MLKFLRLSNQFLKSSTCRKLSVQIKIIPGGIGDNLLSRFVVTEAGKFPATQDFVADGKSMDKVLAAYCIYKGKCALSSRPILPTFSKSGGGFKVDRRGTVMLTFWPAIGERKYDWEKKQLFALSATEIGSLINLGPEGSCEFFHDPSMLSSNAGQVRKSLSIKPHGDGSGYFFSLNVVNNILQTNDRLVVPVTSAEFAVMRTVFTFALPHLMGWDQYTNLASRSTSQKAYKVDPQLMDSEWDR